MIGFIARGMMTHPDLPEIQSHRKRTREEQAPATTAAAPQRPAHDQRKRVARTERSSSVLHPELAYSQI